MAQELVYTSVPKGLDPRRTGFCTVAMTRGMSPYMVKQLEGLTAYTPVFMHYDANSSYNPPSFFHYPILDGRKNYELLARVSDCGLDYTKRSNKIGHFILISMEERARLSEGPSCLLSEQYFMTEWTGEPQYFPAERTLNCANIASRKAVAWEKVTGDAGWAAWLAEWYLAEPDKPCFVIFDPLKHLNLQALVCESLMLLPRNRRWDVTWNTYLSALPAGLSCNWRFCVGNPDILRSIGCNGNANVLDLRKKLGVAGNTQLSQSARMGTNPFSDVKQTTPTIAASAGFAQSERENEGTSLNAILRKHQQEEEEKAAKKTEEVSRQVTPLRSSVGVQYQLNTTNNTQMVEDGVDIQISFLKKNEAKWKRRFFIMSGITLCQFVVIIMLLPFYILSIKQQHSVENAVVVKQETGPQQSAQKTDNYKTSDDKVGDKVTEERGENANNSASNATSENGQGVPPTTLNPDNQKSADGNGPDNKVTEERRENAEVRRDNSFNQAPTTKPENGQGVSPTTSNPDNQKPADGNGADNKVAEERSENANNSASNATSENGKVVPQATSNPVNQKPVDANGINNKVAEEKKENVNNSASNATPENGKVVSQTIANPDNQKPSNDKNGAKDEMNGTQDKNADKPSIVPKNLAIELPPNANSIDDNFKQAMDSFSSSRSGSKKSSDGKVDADAKKKEKHDEKAKGLDKKSNERQLKFENNFDK